MLRQPAHPTRSLAIALPLALVAWYALTQQVPGLLAPPPHYDLVYMADYGGEKANNSLHIDVKEGHATATFIGENFGYGWPRLFRFNARTGKATEIKIIQPPSLPVVAAYNRPAAPLDEEPHTPVPVPALEKLPLITSLTAPDSYRFKAADYAKDAPFYWPKTNLGVAAIVQYSARYPLPNPPGKGRPVLTFLGWVQP